MAGPAKRSMGLIGVSVAMSTGYLAWDLPNTFLLNQSKDILQAYKNSLPVQVSRSVQTLVDNVKMDLRLSPEEKKKIKVFTPFGHDAVRIGVLNRKNGGYVGIPTTYSYNTLEDFRDRLFTHVGTNKINWDTAEAKALRTSLVLSDRAKKFSIAREITHLTYRDPEVMGSITGIAAMAHYQLTRYINRRLNMFARPFKARLLIYLGVAVVSGFFANLALKGYTRKREYDSDKHVGSLGDDYVMGGLEFYDKIIVRNKALRLLLEESGNKFYTAQGNDQTFLFNSHRTFNERRDYFSHLASELQFAKVESAISSFSNENS